METETTAAWWVGANHDQFYRTVAERRPTLAAKFGSDGVINFATTEPPYADRKRGRAQRLRDKAGRVG
jgi:hypothetical protein